LSAEHATYANCPQCRLSMRVRALSVAPVNCPRCLAKRGEIVELFLSPQPFRLLTGDTAEVTPAPGRIA
jgi:hypothetical protein